MMTLTNKAIWTIERNLGRELTLGEVAQASGVSPHHLAHAFGAAAGLSVMHYVRGRRLSEAARALANGAPDILALALDAGYASHEAFSRAFKAQFGKTPEAIRRDGISGLALIEPLQLSEIRGAKLAEPRFEQAGAMLVIGLAQRYAFEATQGIPAQWQRFMSYYDDIPNKVREIPLGVNSAIDAEGDFDYVSAVEVSKFTDTPSDLVRMKIAPQRYAVFPHREHVAKIGATYSAIWNEWLPTQNVAAVDAPGLEFHRETFDTRTGEGGVDIWIPVTESRS